MDPATVATTAITAALPYLAQLGKETAKSAAGSAGKSIWEWLKGKLTSHAGKEGISGLESAPGDVDSRRLVEAVLSKVLKSDPSALAELYELLEQTGALATSKINVTASYGGIAAGRDIRGNTIKQTIKT